MRTLDPSHRWNHSIAECFACGCSTQSDHALMPCTNAPPVPKIAQAPKAPDLFVTSTQDPSIPRG